MAVNLIDQFGRARAREILESSFAQFQADRAVVGLAREAGLPVLPVHRIDADTSGLVLFGRDKAVADALVQRADRQAGNGPSGNGPKRE
jgi:23S rRNA-/tRNA-specific pseudouridylate synthase